MKITVLIENKLAENAPSGLEAEHGLSILIENDGHKLLFDTGKTHLFAENAAALGIELKDVDTVVISHAHYDHGGGLATFLSQNSKAKIFLHANSQIACYSEKAGGYIDYIGLDKELWQTHKDRFYFTKQNTSLGHGFGIITQIESRFPISPANKTLLVKQGAEYVPDTFAHELVLTVTQDEKLFVFTGCAHSGVVNMVAAATEQHPEKQLSIVFGGFHLYSPSHGRTVPRTYLDKLAKELNPMQADFYTGHCTGEEAFQYLKKILGDRLHPFGTGSMLEL